MQLRPISEALPPTFSTKAGALGYLAPPAAPRATMARPSRRPLLIGAAIALAMIAIGVIAAIAH